jgi:hypothetical protein
VDLTCIKVETQLEHNEAVSSIAILAGSSVGQILIIILRIVFGVALIAAGVVALGIGISAATISALHLLIAGAVPHMSVLCGLGSDSLFMNVLNVLAKAHSVLYFVHTEGLDLVRVLGQPSHLILVVVLIRRIRLYIDVLQLYHLIKD